MIGVYQTYFRMAHLIFWPALVLAITMLAWIIRVTVCETLDQHPHVAIFQANSTDT
jgi:hypothetical protein